MTVCSTSDGGDRLKRRPPPKEVLIQTSSPTCVIQFTGLAASNFSTFPSLRFRRRFFCHHETETF